MTRWAASTHVIVIERGKIVMNKGRGMKHFKRNSNPQCRRL
jgi:hypothetical protein